MRRAMSAMERLVFESMIAAESMRIFVMYAEGVILQMFLNFLMYEEREIWAMRVRSSMVIFSK